MKKLRSFTLSSLIIAFSVVLALADDNPFFRAELIFDPEKVPFKSCHGSTLTELPDGDVLAGWYGGDYERAKNNLF